MSKQKKKDALDPFLPEARVNNHPIYIMVRFSRRPDLIEYATKRAKSLGVSRESYIVALIAQDKESHE